MILKLDRSLYQAIFRRQFKYDYTNKYYLDKNNKNGFDGYVNLSDGSETEMKIKKNSNKIVIIWRLFLDK